VALRGGRGKINFDMLLASPEMMPKLARVAKFLGPRGLMPNPKNNTLTNDPEKVAASFKKGQINFRTETKSPIIHLSVGKISYGTKKLFENITTLIDAIKKERIRNVTLKSTMSPGIKLEV
jgi:large subunit ribosomal protein L1